MNCVAFASSPVLFYWFCSLFALLVKISILWPLFRSFPNLQLLSVSNAMSSDQNCLRSLLFPLILLVSFSKLLLNGALLANVQPRVNSIVDFHSSINQLESAIPNYCNESKLIEQSGLIRAPMGQFLGFPCSNEFYHCRWQSDGYRTYKKNCRAGLVYDVLGTQNCNYDYNVKGCAMGPSGGGAVTNCTAKDLFECPLSEDCVPLSKRCDGNYDCVLEEDEQNCPMCKPTHFPCVVSEQCIPLGQRCNGIKECQDGTDELECENCGAGKFMCRKSGKCIGAKERCDGFAHCPHGEDELLCKKARIVLGPRMFVCENGKHQIPQQNVCDGVVHCPDDASDEKYCQVGTATEPMRQVGPGTMPSPNAPPNQLATPTTAKIAFDQPINAQWQQQQQQMSTGKHGQWVGVSEGKSSITLTNQPPMAKIDGQAKGEAFPILNIVPMRKTAERRDGNAKVQEPFPIMTRMMNLERLDSNGTNRLMVEMPRERKPQENNEKQQQTGNGIKTLVEGDFQPGVWNGSALQQQNNPYADEWYRQKQQNGGVTDGRPSQQQIEQNNLIQEESDQFVRWQKFGGQFIQTNAMEQAQPVITARQQQVEQRRAIKEEGKGETTREGIEKLDERSGAEPNRTVQAVKGEEQQQQQQMQAEHQESAVTTTGAVMTNEDGVQWRTDTPPLLVNTVGLANGGGGKGKQLEMTTADDTKTTAEGPANERNQLTESGNCGSDGEKSLGADGMGEEVTEGTEEAQQKQPEGQAVIGTGQQQTKEDERTKELQKTEGTTAPRQQQVDTQLTRGEERALALGVGKDSEEQEQREILQRLYSKYGSNARDLLQRVENLLLLAEDGILSTKKIPNTNRKSQKMKRRQAEEDKALIRRYLAQIMHIEGNKREAK